MRIFPCVGGMQGPEALAPTSFKVNYVPSDYSSSSRLRADVLVVKFS